ncbi:MAG: glycosyltransferase family 2 protein [Planctomycetaceae bacterium]
MFEPLVTIGIPTFNRVGLLRQSLASAQAQTYPRLEIVVSDNASSDGTAECLRGLTYPRVRGSRSETNRGPAWNFQRVLELAEGELFGWLQDDDLLFPEFAARAVAGLGQHPQAVCSLASMYATPTPNLLIKPWLMGPPVPLDWAGRTPQAIPGDLVLPLSLFLSFAIPPAQIFRTAHLRRFAAHFADPTFPLYTERTLLTAVSKQQTIVADPYVAGMFRQHEQAQSTLLMSQQGAEVGQWVRMVQVLEELDAPQPRVWGPLFRDYLTQIGRPVLQEWRLAAHAWPPEIGLCAEVRQLLEDEGQRRAIPHPQPPLTGAARARQFARWCLPPCVIDTLRAVRRIGS